MPPVSKAQRRLMQAAKAGKSSKVSPSAAKKVLEGDKSGRKIPERKSAKRSR